MKKKNNKSIFDYWVFPDRQPRRTQVKALAWLEKQTAKYILLEAPVGSGKSLIGMTYSRWLDDGNGDAFILTPQKILQEQYTKEFEDYHLYSFYGKSNYPCIDKDTTCDLGSKIKPSCGSSCAASIARKQAQESPNVVMNYALAFASFGYTENFKPRTLMVFDECHVLEDHLVDFDAVTITARRCNKYNIEFKQDITVQELPYVFEWIDKEYIPAMNSACGVLESECLSIMDRIEDTSLSEDERKLTDDDKTKLKELNALMEHIDSVSDLLAWKLEYVNKNFILIQDSEKITFKRLFGSFAFEHMVKPKADKFLFMSSTILDKEEFCSDLGIDPKETAFLSLDSEFPVENRLVKYKPIMKMNYTWNSDQNSDGRKKYIEALVDILEIHKDDWGIIHTGSFAIAEWLVNELNGKFIPHSIRHHNPKSGHNRMGVINSFMTSKTPSILISPSITEGLDLKDNLSRFAIFAKVPFPNLADKWIKRRMEISNRWYQRKTLTNIIQGSGRVVRSPTDWGVTYIMDGSFGYLYSQSYHMVCPWWKKAYRKG